MIRSSVGKDAKVEKSKVCEWVKLPAPSTTHMHPSLLGANEFPDTVAPVCWGCGVADDCGDTDGDAGAGSGAEAEEPQLPKAA